MIQIRPAEARGHANHGWRDSFHSFSFADYYDPEEMGWGVLRVINEDHVAPGMGFGTHGHRDMEIISYVMAGTLQHRDSMGNGTLIRPGEVQRMSAGRGIMHSEFNASQTELVHFLQIWIQPAQRGIEPGYAQKEFPKAQMQGQLRLVVSPDGEDGSITLCQDARLYVGVVQEGESLRHVLEPERLAYLHVAQGSVRLNGQLLETGAGAKIADEAQLQIEGLTSSEVLLFDLPPAQWQAHI